MRQLIGIVIPPDVKAEASDFCMKYQYTLVDPHITLIQPDMLGDVKSLDRKLQSFCLSQPAFNTIIGGPILDPDKALYLTVLPGMLNATRDSLIRYLKRPASKDLYKPHVSLIIKRLGHEYDFPAILAEAKQVFSKPRSISVDSLAIYTQSNPGSAFVIKKQYPFTGR